MSRSRLNLPALCLLAAALSPAATLIEVSGPNDSTLATTIISNNLGVGFSLASDYENVTINIPLISLDPAGGATYFIAQLTRAIGPGAGLADTSGSTSGAFPIPGNTPAPPYTLGSIALTGLSLSAGQYYLVLTGEFYTTVGWWIASPASVRSVVANDGAALTHSALTAPVADVFLFKSEFTDMSGPEGFSFWFSVTGDRVDENSVPEPAAALFVAAALPLLWLRRRITCK